MQNNITELAKTLSIPNYFIEVMLSDTSFYDAEAKQLTNGLLAKETASESMNKLMTKFKENDLGTNLLYCYLQAALKTRETYRAKGIPDDIFVATMGCFQRFIDETIALYGKQRFDRGWWTYRQTSMQLFRLGELEFEYVDENEVSVHVPSDADLSSEKVDASFAKFKEFTKEFCPEFCNANLYITSWIVNPNITNLLNKESRIARFAKRFEIISEKDNYEDVVYWVFKTFDYSNIKELKEDTSLQRALKKEFLKGERYGEATGIIRI